MNGKEAYEIFEDSRLSRAEFCNMTGVSIPTLSRWGNKNSHCRLSQTSRDKVLLVERAVKAGKLPLEPETLFKEDSKSIPSQQDMEIKAIEPGYEWPLKKPDLRAEVSSLREASKNLREKLEASVGRLFTLMEDTMDIYSSLKELKKELEALSKK